VRLLYVCHAPPCPPALGPARRHYHILREAAKRHEMTLVSFGMASDERAFHTHLADACREAVFVDMERPRLLKALHRSCLLLTGRADFRRLYAARFQRALDEVARRRRFDAVILSTLMLARYRVPDAPCLGEAHNVEHELLRRAAAEARDRPRRLYFRVQGALTCREERACAERVQFISAVSARDREQFARWKPASRIFVVPNGVDVAAFARPAGVPPPAQPTVLFTGLFSYYPNALAARRLYDEVLPRVASRVPGVRFVLAGANPPRWLSGLKDPRVVVTGRVDDMRPLFWDATLFAMPLTIGSGTRGKALDAMAAQLPIVSTTLACEGLNLRDNREAIIRDDVDGFASAIVDLIQDERLRRRLADAALERVRAEYDLAAVGRSLDEAIHAVCEYGASWAENRATTSSGVTA
jgi:glycosyltransferase involved in cell wall biosynthesis